MREKGSNEYEEEKGAKGKQGEGGRQQEATQVAAPRQATTHAHAHTAKTTSNVKIIVKEKQQRSGSTRLSCNGFSVSLSRAQERAEKRPEDVLSWKGRGRRAESDVKKRVQR